MSEHSRLTFKLRSHFGNIPLPRCIASLPVSSACGILAACLSCNASSKVSNLLTEGYFGQQVNKHVVIYCVAGLLCKLQN